MLKITQLLGFNAAKPSSTGGWWGIGAGTRELTISAQTYTSIMEYAFDEWGSSIYTVPYHYDITVTGNLVGMSWADGVNSWADGSSFTLINEARISGTGGAGGGGGYAGAGEAAGDGGDALSLMGYEVSIDNAAGQIFGGGGGGGGGGGAVAVSTFVSGDTHVVRAVGTGGGGGGGGQGYNAFGSGGAGDNTLLETQINAVAAQQISTVGTITDTNLSATITSLATDGGDADETAAASGGVGAVASGAAGGNALSVTGGAGGAGGAWGTAGSAGTAGTASGTTSSTAYNGSAGGAAGKAIALGGGSVIWIDGNDAARVKGAVA